MPDTYTVQPNDSLWGISKKLGVSFQELKNANPDLAGRQPPYGVNPGDVIKVPAKQKKGKVKAPCEKCKDCVKHDLAKPPKLIGIARDKNIVTQRTVSVNDDVLHGATMTLGQDITHASDRTAPGGQSVGTDEQVLKDKMRALLGIFAGGDSSGMATRLFDKFLSKKTSIEVFIDEDLDRAAAAHSHIVSFADLTLSAPGTAGANPSKVRLHQALKNAGWDIEKVKTITDLGVPAFNVGDKVWRTGDFNNGLGVMINSVQYVYVVVEAYHYDSCEEQYRITLKFAIYDVFGLDDDDLKEFGASGTWFSSGAGQGITAWWQLQHQFDYVPLITRAVVHRTYVVSTAGQ